MFKSIISRRTTEDLGTELHYWNHKLLNGTINRIVRLIFLPHLPEEQSEFIENLDTRF